MTSSNSSGAAELHRRAEGRLSKKEKSRRSQAGVGSTVHEMERLIQELQVHQIDLEIQNEELRQAWAETEAALELYTELYEFAPSGYFTLDRDGTIQEANQTGSELLGMDRSRLVNR